MSDALHDLARRAGVATEWHDVFGTLHQVSPDTLRALLTSLGHDAGSDAACRDQIAAIEAESHAPQALLVATVGEDIYLPHLPGIARLHLESGESRDIVLDETGEGHARLAGNVPPGYHRLDCGDRMLDVAVAPLRGHTVADAIHKIGRAGKAWGLAAQVYSLTRPGDGGIGDFAALADFVRAAGRHGADAVAISPVHALYAAEPGHYGPYGPSSRIALNPVYAPVDAETQAADLIDWQTATPPRYAALRAAFARDRADPAFRRFLETAPSALRRHAIFEAIAAAEVAAGRSRDWRAWSSELRDPEGAAVTASAEREAEAVAFHLYAQFRARAGLEAAQHAASDSGMAIGLIADLAVGADPAGSDAWSRPEEVLRGASIGAPPDEFNRAGQNWGLTAFSPRGLRHSGFSALRDMLGAALAPTGGVRIDHAMGLARLWLVPEGAEAKDGSYLAYPFEDMRRIVLLESLRHRGVVLAEDLGTVPEGFREHLSAGGIAGMSVLWFERWGDRFAPPAHWRADTAAMSTTHDLPTVAGWWRGTDIAWRERLGIPCEDETKRAYDRPCLWDALCCSGSASGAMPPPEDGEAIADAVARHVGTASSDLAILPMEDALALPEQPNIPGTVDEHPNWRRRLPGPAATLLDDPRVAARLAGLRAARGQS